ncbi:CRISPR-associated endonuclease Cas12a [bioreactor metagenome]|uniref:CRISPR-associated endonuclease Cas12a n=1 Tax=bioreactor metagenome TaxID=1076179 RepID=A0A645BKE5_9ZZZZ
MNFKTVGLNNINSEVNQFLQEADNLHIIGIDRGERHLLYLTVVDMQGNIKEQYSLNEIVNNYNGNVYRTNYKDLLQKREDERDKERKSWKTIENIKELKEGYLSQVIHKITQLMIKYNAIVVLEDLNLGFMRGRQKVEKQVYQKFEKMLIDKLNYLVFKNKATTETGGLLKAYQLTNKFESFQKMGKQNGFLFYIPAWNTSKIDPVTGFVNMFDASYINLEKAKSFFNNFETITFNAKGWFEFEVSDYKKFNPKTIETRTEWTICTYGNRIETYRNATKNNQWDNREVNLTEEFKKLFEKYNISLNNDLKAEILSQTEKAFFERMLYLFRLTVQMRNSETNTEKDYMISPIADENGNFYNSDTEKNKGKDENGNWISQLPVDADANGAYNIARKGLILIEKIKQSEKLDKLDLFITNKEWLQFAQKQNK